MRTVRLIGMHVNGDHSTVNVSYTREDGDVVGVWLDAGPTADMTPESVLTLILAQKAAVEAQDTVQGALDDYVNVDFDPNMSAHDIVAATEAKQSVGTTIKAEATKA